MVNDKTPWRWRAHTTIPDDWRLRVDIPQYQSYCTECPKCACQLHYSCGMDRRACDTCGWVEGAVFGRSYPTAYSFREYLNIGQEFYNLKRYRLIDQPTMIENLMSITTWGSIYRPPGED